LLTLTILHEIGKLMNQNGHYPFYSLRDTIQRIATTNSTKATVMSRESSYRPFTGNPLHIGLLLLIWVSFTSTFFFPRSWWTRNRLIVVACVLLLETAAGFLWLHETKLIYMFALVIFSTSLQIFLSRSAAPAVVTLMVTAILYVRLGREDVFSFLSFVLLAIALYFNIRSRMQRNEMHELNKQQLIELHDAYEQLQEASVKDMQYAVLEERTRIARDMHDAVGHSLTSLIVQMQAMRYMLERDPAQATQALEDMLVVARQGLQDIRTSVHSLAEDQSSLGILPLKALLARMEASTSIRYSFHTSMADEHKDTQLNGICFRVLQEAITNVIRHAKASEVEVNLTSESGNWVLRIRDNGISTTRRKINEGFGLKVMRARVEEIGGQLHYAILEPSGFEIVAEIPMVRMDEYER
jgi:signal transduction histidine kinase